MKSSWSFHWLLALLTLFLLAFAGCSPQSTSRNHLVVYSAGPRPLIETIVHTFTEETGIDVDLFVATTGQVMARLEAEKYRPRADVVVFASNVAAEALRKDNRLMPYPSPPWWESTRWEWHDPDFHYFTTSATVVGMAIREEAYTPTIDWRDITQSTGASRVTMPSPSRSGAAGDFLVGYLLHTGEDGWDFFRSARASGMDFAAANSQAITSLMIGAYDFIVGAVDYLIYRQIADGAAIRMHFPPSGSVQVNRPIAIMAETPVPETARRFVDHYFSEPSQRLVSQTYLIPAHRRVPVNGLRADPGEINFLPVDTTQALRNQNLILRRFQLEIERAAVIRP